MRLILMVGAVAVMAMAPVRVNAKIIADCERSTGKSYFMTPPSDGWVDDSITGGRLLFDLRKDSDLNLIFVDATGQLIDSEKDGGKTFLVSHSEGYADFTAATIYPHSGVIETFAVTNSGRGARTLLWTSNKSRIPPINLTKVSAFVAECDS